MKPRAGEGTFTVVDAVIICQKVPRAALSLLLSQAPIRLLAVFLFFRILPFRLSVDAGYREEHGEGNRLR